MNTKNNHCPEHITFPAHKMIEKGVLQSQRDSHVYQGGGICLAGKICNLSAGQRKVLKKTHKKRSRRFLKEQLRGDIMRCD